MKVIINSTSGSILINDVGVSIPASGQYVITPQDYLIWAASRDTIDLIANDTIVVNDGEDNLRKKYGVALIQDNQRVLDEHYTLVEDDSVLIGNGKILYLNDVFETTDNVPGYLDEQIEDDDPTEA